MIPFDYHRPRSLDEARRLKATVSGAEWVAGGTDLIVRIKQGTASPSALISLRNVPDLYGIHVAETVRVGAATIIRDIADHGILAERYPALVQAARALGGVQIRNAATIGGNLCNASPCADTALGLLVHDASVEILGHSGVRSVPLARLFVGRKQTALAPGDLLTAILPGTRGASVFLKKKRVAMDLSIASIAVRLDMDGDRCREVRVAAGSLAPTPVRLTGVEELLTGRELTPALLREAQAAASAEVQPITDVRGEEGYRRTLAGVYVRRALETLWRPA